jgi:sec-independent protein translocase protein TatC
MISAELTLSEHIADLRRTLILCLLALASGFILALPLAEPFIALLKEPAPPHLVLLGPIQGFTVVMKCALFLGAFLSSPLWLLSLWRFLAPGLKTRENSVVILLFSSLLLFFTAGAALGYFFILPPAIQFLENFGEGLGTNMWSLSAYLEFCLFVLFGSGLSLELFFFLLLLVHFKILTYPQLASSRRAAIVSCFILGALLTPPDIATQFMLAIPLWLLFEICLLYAYLKTN